MRSSTRALLTVIVAGIAATSMALAAGAFGAHGPSHPGKPNRAGKPVSPGNPGHPSNGRHRGRPLIKESLAPSQPSDPSFHGVSPGMAPWVLQRGEVRVKGDGKVALRVKGLVIPSPPGDGTPGPVITVSASLYCGAVNGSTCGACRERVAVGQPCSTTADCVGGSDCDHARPAETISAANAASRHAMRIFFPP